VGDGGLEEASPPGEGRVAVGASERKRTRGRGEGTRVEDIEARGREGGREGG
jgi:hypothetical protein